MKPISIPNLLCTFVACFSATGLLAIVGLVDQAYGPNSALQAVLEQQILEQAQSNSLLGGTDLSGLISHEPLSVSVLSIASALGVAVAIAVPLAIGASIFTSIGALLPQTATALRTLFFTLSGSIMAGVTVLALQLLRGEPINSASVFWEASGLLAYGCFGGAVYAALTNHRAEKVSHAV